MRFVVSVGVVVAVVALEAGVSWGEVVKSAGDGPWSEGKTWEHGRTPQPGDQVLIRSGHHVLYDRNAPEPMRAVHIAGKLRFAVDRDTRLDVGLIRIAADETMTEEGFDCLDLHIPSKPSHVGGKTRPTLEVGRPDQPIPAEHSALIRLVYFEGMNKESLPAVVCCGGRMDFHGAPVSPSWVKLGDAAAVGETRASLAETVQGWKVGDRVLITGTSRQRPFAGHVTPHVTDSPASEVRTITKIDVTEQSSKRFRSAVTLHLDAPLEHPHRAEPGYAGEAANLSRNVVVESADPHGVRGHTMYHAYSQGSISYAEFRHLGKEGVLGRYALHYHLTGDSMRGSYLRGASIWDSANRWLTIHGAHYLVVQDCVGYRSVGHGFYLEDGTETFNLLDRCLAVQALVGKPLPKQALPFDQNDGGGFWWANSMNAFTRCTAAECDQHAFRFEVVKSAEFDPVLPTLQPDGSTKRVDVRTLPFLRFEDNEAHAQRRFALNLGGIRGMVFGGGADQPDSVGGSVDGVGPDVSHPFVIRNFKVWDSHWAFHCGTPAVQVDGLDVYDCQYGIWRSVMSLHEYRNLSLRQIKERAIFFPMGVPGPAIELKDGQPSFPNYRLVDDRPPVTVATDVVRRPDGLLEVLGTTVDDDHVASVHVNDVRAESLDRNFARWKVTLPVPKDGLISAYAIDQTGNVEPRPHVRSLDD